MPSRQVRVLVVWEAVLPDDSAAPSSQVLGRMPDARVQPFWDPNHAVADAIAPGLRQDVRPVVGKRELIEAEPVWDFVGVYPPGLTWDQRPPLPTFKGAPVAGAIKELRAAMTSTP